MEETTRAARLLQNLLQLARRDRPERIPCVLDHEIGLVLSLMAPQFRRLEVEVVTESGSAAPVSADPTGIRQVVLNLVQNAVQAMAKADGPRRLTLRTRAAERWMRLEVADTGPGIPAVPRVFDAFFTTKPAAEGTGLGLWVSAEVIRAHEGRIWAESRPEGGASFFVELPVA